MVPQSAGSGIQLILIPFYTLSFPTTIMGWGEPWKQVDYSKGFN